MLQNCVITIIDLSFPKQLIILAVCNIIKAKMES